MMMLHKRQYSSLIYRIVCVVVSFVLLFSFFPDRVAAAATEAPVYVGTDADFFREYFASKYASDTQSEEELMDWFYECYNDCHVIVASNSNSSIFFLPDDFYYAVGCASSTYYANYNYIRSYTYFDHMYYMSFADGSMQLSRVNINSVNYNSNGYYQGSVYSNNVSYDYLVGNLNMTIYPFSSMCSNSNYFLYSNIDWRYYNYQGLGSSSTYTVDYNQNIKKLTVSSGLTYYINSDDPTRVSVFFPLLGLLQKDIDININMISVNRWGTEIPFNFSYSDKGLAGTVKEGENISILLGQYVGYGNTIENVTAAAPVTAVNIYIDSVILTFTNADGEQTTFYQDKDLYLVIGDPSLIDNTPDYDYDDKYDGPEGDYSSGIDSSDIAGRYNLTPIEVSSDGSTVDNIPDWANALFLVPFQYSENDSIYNLGDTYVSSVVGGWFGTNITGTNDHFRFNRHDTYFVNYDDFKNYVVLNYEIFTDNWYDLVGGLSTSYDIIYVVGYEFTGVCNNSSSTTRYFSQSTRCFATERLYKRSVCYYMTDGFSMMGDYLYDISQENNAIYSVLYSGLSDKSSPLVQMRDNSITQLAVLNNILSSIDKIQPSCSFEPYDDTAVLSGIWAAVNAINNQEVFSDVTILGKLEQILNTLNGSAGFDSTAILDKIDEAIIAIKNIKINVEQNIYQEAQKSILDRVLDILQQIIESIISLVTKLVEILLDFVARFLNDVLDLFEYIKKLFTEGLDGDYMTVFDSPDPEVNARITGAAAYLSSVSFLFSCLPKVVQLLIVLSVFMSVTLIIMKGVAFNG